jgi:nitrate/nitrite transporter NarK
LIGTIGIFSNGLFRFCWGFLFDYFSYKTIVFIINSCLILCCISVLFAVEHTATYFFIVICIYINYGGIFAIAPAQSFKMLGH